MENQSISTHLVVVSQSSGKLSDIKANSRPEADSGTDFANLLAAQIQGEGNAPVLPDAVNLGQKPLEDADKAAAADSAAAISNAPPAADQLLNTLNSLQLPLAQNTLLDTQSKLRGDGKPVDALALEQQINTKLAASTDSTSALDQAAKAAIDPAKIAINDKALPTDAFRDIKTETNNLNSASLANLTQVNRATPLPTNAAPIAPPAVEIPVGYAGWDAAFSQRVAWVATNTQQVAHLQINPPNLGPIEIRISLASDQTHAAFTSPHAAVREAIEAALPRLREMLADNGLSLGNVNVSSQSFQQQQQSQAGQGNDQRYDPFQALQRIAVSAGSAALTAQGVAAITHANIGLVDIFA